MYINFQQTAKLNFNFFRAVKAGDCLLIEDVHLAPSDVMSTLLPLIERGQLHVPSRGVVIKASPGKRHLEVPTIQGHDSTK